MPREHIEEYHGSLSPGSSVCPFKFVPGNVQSWLAGTNAALLFLPTTIGALVWATAFLHAGEHVSMADAAFDASMEFFLQENGSKAVVA